MPISINGKLVLDDPDTNTGLLGLGIITVGVTPIELSFSSETKTINVTSLATNSGNIYLGYSNVTSAGDNSFDVLDAGQSINLNYDDSSNPIYAVSDTADQYIIAGATL